MKRALILLLCTTGLVANAAAAPLFGRKPEPPGLQPDGFAPRGEPQEHRDETGLSAQQAAREAQQRNGGGRVLSVDETGNGWRVKLLKDGNVRIVFIPN